MNNQLNNFNCNNDSDDSRRRPYFQPVFFVVAGATGGTGGVTGPTGPTHPV